MAYACYFKCNVFSLCFFKRGFRFRYPCEGLSLVGLPGAYSEKGSKSYPSVWLHNYHGPARIVVSLVTVTEPHMPHAHSLIGKNSNDGVVTVQIGPEHGMIAWYCNLDIVIKVKTYMPEICLLERVFHMAATQKFLFLFMGGQSSHLCSV